MRSYLPEERVAAGHIHFVMSEYGKKYYVPTFTTQARLVDELNHHIDKNEDFRDAFSLLGLNGLMGKINEISEETLHNYRLLKSTNSLNQERRAGVRKAAYKDLKVMVDAINFMFQFNRDDKEKTVEIKSLMLEIDGVLKDFSRPMKLRKTKLKTKKLWLMLRRN